MLFEDPPRFNGLPRDGFEVFSIPAREERRRSIIAKVHPALEALAEDLVGRLSAAEAPLHAHLPRLDWPKGYQPFCTWLALSRHAQGYQDGPQLNVGVHGDHVGVRLGWDTSADAFGRFEFLCLYGGLGSDLISLARNEGLRFRVFAAADWPEGSALVLDTPTDIRSTFAEVKRRGVWWELGRRYEIPAALSRVSSPAFGAEVAAVFRVLLPVHERILGDRG